MRIIRRWIAGLLIVPFLSGMVMPSALAADVMSLMPRPGSMVALTGTFAPALMVGLQLDPQNPFNFNFLIDRGQNVFSDDEKSLEYKKLIKYFLAALTTPNKDMWVNLSPFEHERIIPDNFGMTEMGRDLLAQDYLLKQITSSLIYPEGEVGKKFWQKVYAAASAKYGTTDIPLDTFNKVWIIPDKAVIFEKKDTVLAVESHLKVMLDADYTAVRSASTGIAAPVEEARKGAQELSNAVIREIVLPALEKEVNEGENFAQLRQIYSAMLLATWFKKALKKSILGQAYADKSKVAGIELHDPDARERIYQQYLRAYKVGAFNFIKEEQDVLTQEIIPRKYFSGGINTFDDAMITFADNSQAKDFGEKHKRIDRAEIKLERAGSLGMPDAAAVSARDEEFLRRVANALDALGYGLKKKDLMLNFHSIGQMLFFMRTSDVPAEVKVADEVNTAIFSEGALSSVLQNLIDNDKHFRSGTASPEQYRSAFKVLVRSIRLMKALKKKVEGLPLMTGRQPANQDDTSSLDFRELALFEFNEVIQKLQNAVSSIKEGRTGTAIADQVRQRYARSRAAFNANRAGDGFSPYKGMTSYNSRPASDQVMSLLNIVLRAVPAKGIIRIRESGIGFGVAAGQVTRHLQERLGKGEIGDFEFHADTLSPVPDDVRVLARHEEVKGMLADYLIQHQKPLSGVSAEMAAWMQRLLESYKKMQGRYSPEMTRKSLMMIMGSEGIQLEILYALQAQGYEIFELLNKPYLDRLDIGHFNGVAPVRIPGAGYDLLYDNRGGIYYSFKSSPTSSALKNACSMLGDNGILFLQFVPPESARDLPHSIPEGFTAIFSNGALTVVNQKSRHYEKLRTLLSEPMVRKDNYFEVGNFSAVTDALNAPDQAMRDDAGSRLGPEIVDDVREQYTASRGVSQRTQDQYSIFRGITEYNSRRFSADGRRVLKAALSAVPSGRMVRVRESGIGSGRSAGDIFEMLSVSRQDGEIADFRIDADTQTRIPDRVRLRAGYAMIKDMIEDFLLNRIDEVRDVLTAPGLASDEMKPWQQFILTHFGGLADHLGPGEIQRALHRKKFDRIPFEMLYALQGAGYPVFELLDKPFINNMDIGSFGSAQVAADPDVKYDFLYDDRGGISYAFGDTAINFVLAKACRLLNDNGILFINWLMNTLNSEAAPVPDGYAAIRTEEHLLVVKKGSVHYRKLSGLLAGRDEGGRIVDIIDFDFVIDALNAPDPAQVDGVRFEGQAADLWRLVSQQRVAVEKRDFDSDWSVLKMPQRRQLLIEDLNKTPGYFVWDVVDMWDMEAKYLRSNVFADLNEKGLAVTGLAKDYFKRTLLLLAENFLTRAGVGGFVVCHIDDQGMAHIAAIDAGLGFHVDEKGVPVIEFDANTRSFRQDPLSRGKGQALGLIAGWSRKLSIFTQGYRWDTQLGLVKEDVFKSLYGTMVVVELDLKDNSMAIDDDAKLSKHRLSELESRDLGGIDLNDNNLDLQTRGGGIDFNLPPEWQGIDLNSIQGLAPVIINITPVADLNRLLGLSFDPA